MEQQQAEVQTSRSDTTLGRPRTRPDTDDVIKHRAASRAWLHRARYGITEEERHSKFEQQGGCCEMCSEPIPIKEGAYWHGHLDHDHVTGQARGILCPTCNTVVGFVEKHTHRIKMVPTYLAQYIQ